MVGLLFVEATPTTTLFDTITNAVCLVRQAVDFANKMQQTHYECGAGIYAEPIHPWVDAPERSAWRIRR